jgi:hypothetical protein
LVRSGVAGFFFLQQNQKKSKASEGRLLRNGAEMG